MLWCKPLTGPAIWIAFHYTHWLGAFKQFTVFTVYGLLHTFIGWIVDNGVSYIVFGIIYGDNVMETGSRDILAGHHVNGS